MADLASVQANWDLYARTDPLWAILTDPSKRDGKWDLEAFFESGVLEIETVLNHVERLGLSPDYEGVAVDFGCGVGTLEPGFGEPVQSRDRSRYLSADDRPGQRAQQSTEVMRISP